MLTTLAFLGDDPQGRVRGSPKSMGTWNGEAQTGLEKTVRAWIGWARQELPSAGDIPPIFNIGSIFNAGWRQDPWWNTAGRALPWDYPASDFLDSYFGDFDDQQAAKVLSAFEELNLADLPTRFVALSVCYALAHYEPVFLNEDLASQNRDAHEKNLAHLIRLVPVEFFGDWRTIRWEILNAYVISDWPRAFGLYNRAEELDLLRPGEIQALRGQFRFLAALGEEITPSLDSLLWAREVCSPVLFEHGLLFLGGLVTIDTKTAPADLAREMLRQAAVDLETARDKGYDLPPAYRAVLARCYFLTEHFADAAEEYERLLSGHLEVFGTNFKGVIYRSAATSLQRGGLTEKAREIVESWLAEYPYDPEALRVMAEVQARRLNFKEACEYYKRLVDLKPELEEDVATKIALALGGVSPAELSRVAEDLMKKRPEATELIKSLNLELWPAYKSLGDPARKKWLHACCLMYYMPSLEPAQKAGWYQSAAFNFALAVEIEMKTRMFGQFKVEMKSNERLKKVANQGRSHTETRPFCEYLLSPGSGVFTLGNMHWVLKNCGESQQPVLREFRDWLRKRNPVLLEAKAIGVLEDVVGLRNPVGHDPVSPEEASKAPGLCLSILEILYERPGAGS